jgi:hypothetical protein
VLLIMQTLSHVPDYRGQSLAKVCFRVPQRCLIRRIPENMRILSLKRLTLLPGTSFQLIGTSYSKATLQQQKRKLNVENKPRFLQLLFAA